MPGYRIPSNVRLNRLNHATNGQAVGDETGVHGHDDGSGFRM